MDCLVLACVVATAGPPVSGAERIQEQFEHHYLQRRELAGPDGSEAVAVSALAGAMARRPVPSVVRSVQVRP